MGIKVAKFGGTSLADAGQFRKVEKIILADADRRYVVPSAPGKRHADDKKITDLLILCHAHACQSLAFDNVFELIEQRFCELIAELQIDVDLSESLNDVKRQIAGGASLDYAASRGEFLNGRLVAAMLGYEFIDAADVIYFDPRGRFDARTTHQTLGHTLANHPHAVIPGYYGSLPDGRIKTFGRGGSDVTGAIVARAVGAEVYENWTDVSGLLMADPRIVDQPKPIDVVTYAELRELSYMGASVLHDEAVFPVRQAGIPVNIRNTNAPDDSGTLIVSSAAPIAHAGGITGIAGKKDFSVISIEKAMMNREIGFARRMLSVLEEHKLSFEHMPSGIDTVSLVLEDEASRDCLETIVQQIRMRCEPDEITLESGMALIATVGRGMSHHPGMAAKLFTALGDAGVNIRMIDQGSSELNIIVGVEAADFEVAVRAIYHRFVE